MISVANEPPARSGEHGFAFGSLRLFPSQRLLLEGDTPVRLGSRALDILTVLVEHAGRVVPKEELIARVWPNIFVDESNLKIQVSALRRAVGDGQGGVRYIITVPGRGYEFVAPVRRTEEPSNSTPPAATIAVNHNLPVGMRTMYAKLRPQMWTCLPSDCIPQAGDRRRCIGGAPSEHASSEQRRGDLPTWRDPIVRCLSAFNPSP
jgi:DNA-binding winged helix-turn-helix (wHTH) protein